MANIGAQHLLTYLANYETTNITQVSEFKPKEITLIRNATHIPVASQIHRAERVHGGHAL